MKLIKILNKVIDEKVISEKEINLIKRRLDNGHEELDQECIELIEKLPFLNIILTEKQFFKALDYLYKIWKTPKGMKKKNNPFNHNEEIILENAKQIQFDGFQILNCYSNYYVPVYTVIGEYSSFQYLKSDEIKIIG